jgi:glycosyltransferase involved in cell wall biosynthesis
MNLADQITPLILTYNEAPNLRRTLEMLSWANEILVVDSFSTDETLEIARSFPQMHVVQRKFVSFADQCNFGLKQARTKWVLSLDADYVLSPELVAEIQSLPQRADVAGYAARFRFCIHGRPLRASLYPPRTVLYQRSKARYHNDGHGHRVQVDGNVIMLSGRIDHDDRKPLAHWLWAQDRYAVLEAAKLAEAMPGELGLPDRIRRKIVLAPALVFFYTLLAQGMILDGWPGWYYVFQRTFAEILLSLRLIEMKLEKWKPESRKQK